MPITKASHNFYLNIDKQNIANPDLVIYQREHNVRQIKCYIYSGSNLVSIPSTATVKIYGSKGGNKFGNYNQNGNIGNPLIFDIKKSISEIEGEYPLTITVEDGDQLLVLVSINCRCVKSYIHNPFLPEEDLTDIENRIEAINNSILDLGNKINYGPVPVEWNANTTYTYGEYVSHNEMTFISINKGDNINHKPNSNTFQDNWWVNVSYRSTTSFALGNISQVYDNGDYHLALVDGDRLVTNNNLIFKKTEDDAYLYSISYSEEEPYEVLDRYIGEREFQDRVSEILDNFYKLEGAVWNKIYGAEELWLKGVDKKGMFMNPGIYKLINNSPHIPKIRKFNAYTDDYIDIINPSYIVISNSTTAGRYDFQFHFYNGTSVSWKKSGITQTDIENNVLISLSGSPEEYVGYIDIYYKELEYHDLY